MDARANVTALLGPTNTGKTHHAVERMLGHPNGMIGLPLRLLAREVYDRIVERAGEMSVALVTGEEKLIPPSARYWVCTVEAMPLDIPVSFMAIDEIQLAADAERGHVFTDRLLHARGLNETLLLGAATIKPLLEKLLKGVNYVSRPRFSRLTFAGTKKITRLPKRTAIVAFSANMVYSVAELIRRQRGGTAVVMGALSPRTRNAQVELYQSGDVDHIVATDAIGMGLNMDIDHVAFAATRKFDGFQFRNLSASEMGQIAGRAGRYMNDGTFGLTADAGTIEPETIERLQDHRFEAIKVLQWRNRNLNFASIDRLLGSLNALPNREGLTRTRPGADIETLSVLARDREIAERASARDTVELLWETCQLPDYRNITGSEHANLVGSIFRYVSNTGRIDADWFARQLAYCDNTNGDIDTLSNRIAHVRTWTFVANRPDWLEDPAHWQERTRAMEDRLSDALHERLTQRFIDRRTSVLMKRLREREELMSSVDSDGTVLVEGEQAGQIVGLRFVAETGSGEHAKVLIAAAQQTVAETIIGRAQSLVAAPDPDLRLDASGQIIWMSHSVGRLAGSENLLKPRVEVLADEQLSGPDREAVQMRLSKFTSRHIAAQLEPLVSLSDADDITGIARGIAFQIVENLGVLARDKVASEVKSLPQDERAMLRKHGVRFGAFHIFVPAILKPAPTSLRLLLWALFDADKRGLDASALPAAMPQQGLTSVPVDTSVPDGFYQIVGFRVCGARAVRVDMLERLGDMVRTRVFWKKSREGEERPDGSVDSGGFTVVPDMMSLVGCSGEEFSSILKSLGFSAQKRPAPEKPVEVPVEKPVERAAEQPAAEQPVAEQTAIDTPAVAATPETAPEIVEVVQEPAAETTTPGEEDTAEEAIPAEPEMIEVWWPKDTGPFRQQKQQAANRPKANRPPRGKQGRGDKEHHTAGGNKPKGGRDARPPRKEKQADPNSPFAVLGQLKQDLAKK
jgi:ATP-dependent RNA helicase SUPV3L1/SUV3